LVKDLVNPIAPKLDAPVRALHPDFVEVFQEDQ
jgi:hypothetical protein